MIRYSVQPRDRKIVKGYGFLSFAKNMDKIISKSFSGKYSQKLLDYAEKSATDALKTFSKKAIQKTAEATGDLIGNKIIGLSKNLHQNNSETVTNNHDKEIPKERYVSPEDRQEIKTV